MTFRVIDKKTGKEPTDRVIYNIAKKGGLMAMDIDQFFVGEDGSIVLADDCGNMAYVDMERFIVVEDTEREQLPKWVTNGDVIVTLFPNMKVEKFATFVKLSDGEHYIPFGYEWWNEPYKRDEACENYSASPTGAESEDKE
jgi:hypothetical protein